MKQHYLVVYDYDTGGLWALINARSAADIAIKYPALKIVATRPGWMTDKIYADVVACNVFDIDDPPSGWRANI